MSKYCTHLASLPLCLTKPTNSTGIYGPYVVKGRVQSRLLPKNRDFRFAPTGEANLPVDEVEVLQLEKEKLEVSVHGIKAKPPFSF